MMNSRFLFSLFLITLLLTVRNTQAQPAAVQETSLGFHKVLDMEFNRALDSVKAQFKKAGFGVLTEVDVKATMKKKLDVDFRPYQILGVCNPPLAHKALQAEEEIGLLLPCKVIVYVNGEGKTVVSAVDPLKMMQGLDNEQLNRVARTVQAKFKTVLERL